MHVNRLLLILALVLVTGSIGCEVNRARKAEPRPSTTLSSDAIIRIPGPYSIRQDGSVAYQAIARPDGHLLDTRLVNGLTREQVDPWIRQTARSLGGSLVYVRRIVGPYRLDPESTDPEEPMLYDVTIEIWQPRGNENGNSSS